MADDVSLLAALGQKHFHFQVSWARIIPNGSAVNEAALAFYDRLVNALLKGGHRAVHIALEVFDFPKDFQKNWAGWLGRPQVAAYASFAELIFTRFRGRVHAYFSFHEPQLALCILTQQAGDCRASTKRQRFIDTKIQCVTITLAFTTCCWVMGLPLRCCET